MKQSEFCSHAQVVSLALNDKLHPLPIPNIRRRMDSHMDLWSASNEGRPRRPNERPENCPSSHSLTRWARTVLHKNQVVDIFNVLMTGHTFSCSLCEFIASHWRKGPTMVSAIIPHQTVTLGYDWYFSARIVGSFSAQYWRLWRMTKPPTWNTDSSLHKMLWKKIWFLSCQLSIRAP